MILPERIHSFRTGEPSNRSVLYWMSRDQRLDDNWAFIRACSVARERDTAVAVAFCLAPAFLGAGLRQYAFMLSGLAETARRARELGVTFVVLEGFPGDVLPAFVERYSFGHIVTDFDPLRIKRLWMEEVLSRTTVPVEVVDAHNIVPARCASIKKEFSARTFRPRITAQLPRFLEPFPSINIPRCLIDGLESTKEDSRLIERSNPDSMVPVSVRFTPGAKAGLSALERFIERGLSRYGSNSADPLADAVSGLSPWLHFGQISAQRVALAVRDAEEYTGGDVSAFLEQIIVRRELSDNFCLYEERYDCLDSAPSWALKTLDEHRDDPREYIYPRDRLEAADTYDPLWNAAQLEMTGTGYMHNYLRMYWAKKILEWSVSPEEALETAVFLNDRYLLDGRDPNGYNGIMWSIAGVHDRAWGERFVFGKIRYMSAAGCRRKFDVNGYIRRVESGGY